MRKPNLPPCNTFLGSGDFMNYIFNMKKLIPLLLSLTLSACSIMAKVPVTRLESPETTGKEKGSITGEGTLGYQGRANVELTPSYTTTPPSLTNPIIVSPDHRLIGNASAGLADSFDITLALPLRLGAKFQLFGEPRTRADKGNFSVAIALGLSGSKEEETGSSIYSSTQKRFSLSESRYDFALILGYRFSKEVLLYGGPFSVLDDLIVQYSDPATAAPLTTRGRIKSNGYSLGLQARFDTKLFMRIEGTRMKTELGTARSTQNTYGAALGVFL